MIDFIFELIMELIPTLLVETIFEKLCKPLNGRVHNKLLLILIYSIIILFSVVLAIGFALACLFSLGWILFKLNII